VTPDGTGAAVPAEPPAAGLADGEAGADAAPAGAAVLGFAAAEPVADAGWLAAGAALPPQAASKVASARSVPA